MDYLPLFFNLNKQSCLIVGGGSIATRKARLLHKAGAEINVVAPDLDAELAQIIEKSGGVYHCQCYESSLIKDKVLVISATDDSHTNQRVSEDCQAIGLPVNVVDNPKLCTVIMPAIIDRSPLIIGVTSGGEAPVLARVIRKKLESMIPASYGELARLAGKLREKAKAVLVDGEARRRFWEEFFDGPIAEKALNGRIDDAEEGLNQLLDSKVSDPEANRTDGEVYLVGAGPGDPDLLTFKALRLMQRAEVVLFDRLVSEPILDMVRRDADRIYVGKKRDEHAVPQAEINQMLVDLAKQGKRVLRLKGGDPFIFGRGGEEIDLLAEQNIPFQVVPGITAASGCACYSGIPLTHRDYSQSVRFITGHLKEGKTNLHWKEFVEDRQTLVFYMGLVGLPIICERLIEHGKRPDTPAALIEKGTLPEHCVHIGTLADLPAQIASKEVHAPTLLIIGDVVHLHNTLNWYKK